MGELDYTFDYMKRQCGSKPPTTIYLWLISLYALTRRSNLYEQNLIYISELAARDKWDISTASLCIALLISSLFSKNGLNKRELLAQTGIKSSTTLSKKLSILKEYGLLKEKKEVNVIHYNLDYDNLRKSLEK